MCVHYFFTAGTDKLSLASTDKDSLAVVQRNYLYYHYMQNGFNDSVRTSISGNYWHCLSINTHTHTLRISLTHSCRVGVVLIDHCRPCGHGFCFKGTQTSYPQHIEKYRRLLLLQGTKNLNLLAQKNGLDLLKFLPVSPNCYKWEWVVLINLVRQV